MKEESWPKVSVIIPNYNGRRNLGKLLDKCLSSVLKSNYPHFEVIFVDNASTDDSVSYVKQKYKNSSRFKIVLLNKNYGYAGGINIGVRHADPKSKYFFILTTDVEITKNLIKKLVTLFEKYNREYMHIATIHPLIYDKSRGMFIGELFVQYPGCDPLHPWFAVYNNRKPVEVSFPAGEVFMVRKDAFINVGGFDEKYFMYCEDLDLGLRLRLKGYKCLLYPGEVVIHYRSMTSKKELKPPFFSFIIERNRLYTCLKILHRKSLPALIIYEIFRLLGFIMLSTFDKEYRYRLAGYFYAIREIKRRLILLQKVRKRIQESRFISDHELFDLMYNALLRKPMIPLFEKLLLPLSLILYRLINKL